jgi:hypothetical protein
MDSLFDSISFSRRDYMRLSACGALTAALAQSSSSAEAAPPQSPTERLTLEHCLQLTPFDMAQRSTLAINSHRFLLQSADSIKDGGLRKAVSQIIQQPAPLVLGRFLTNDAKEAVKQQLVADGLLKPEIAVSQLFPPAKSVNEPAQPFLSAPGSGYMSHHAYPGGLNVHVALNVRSSLGLFAGYHDTFGVSLNRDTVLAAQLLHDLHKPWVFQWQTDGSLLPEYTVAGTGAHHILSIAESLHRGIPADVVIAQASAHDHPGTPADEEKVVGYLKAGAIIAGINPTQAGLLTSDGKTVALPRKIESFVTHLGDHDWILSVPAAQWTIALLGEIAREDYKMTAEDLKSAKFNGFRNYVFSQTTMIGLHQTHAMAGRDAVRSTVHNLVVPL